MWANRPAERKDYREIQVANSARNCSILVWFRTVVNINQIGNMKKFASLGKRMRIVLKKVSRHKRCRVLGVKTKKARPP